MRDFGLVGLWAWRKWYCGIVGFVRLWGLWGLWACRDVERAAGLGGDGVAAVWAFGIVGFMNTTPLT